MLDIANLMLYFCCQPGYMKTKTLHIRSMSTRVPSHGLAGPMPGESGAVRLFFNISCFQRFTAMQHSIDNLKDPQFPANITEQIENLYESKKEHVRGLLNDLLASYDRALAIIEQYQEEVRRRIG